MNTLSGEVIVFSPFQTLFTYTRNEAATYTRNEAALCGSKFFHFAVDPFSKGAWCKDK